VGEASGIAGMTIGLLMNLGVGGY
ncbi:uncharacterized protein METZ01_LOCUS475875, partial [marine metagenome]